MFAAALNIERTGQGLLPLASLYQSSRVILVNRGSPAHLPCGTSTRRCPPDQWTPGSPACHIHRRNDLPVHREAAPRATGLLSLCQEPMLPRQVTYKLLIPLYFPGRGDPHLELHVRAYMSSSAWPHRKVRPYSMLSNDSCRLLRKTSTPATASRTVVQDRCKIGALGPRCSQGEQIEGR